MEKQDDLLLECVNERDIDLLILEELNVSPDFVLWFAEKSGQTLSDFIKAEARHSISEENGESDIVLEVHTQTGQYTFLIENKIDASAQPEQAKRYMERAAKCHATVVIVAPVEYLEVNAEACKYPHKISYEDIADFFKNQNNQRGIYRARVLQDAIRKARRGYTAKENKDVTLFWGKYYDELRNYIPDADMPKPGVKPAQSDWPNVKFPKCLPAKWVFVHKMSQGHMDLVTTMTDVDSECFQNILESLQCRAVELIKVGKNYTFRTEVPPIDRMGCFEEQIENLHLCFDVMKAVKQLVK